MVGVRAWQHCILSKQLGIQQKKGNVHSCYCCGAGMTWFDQWQRMNDSAFYLRGLDCRCGHPARFGGEKESLVSHAGTWQHCSQPGCHWQWDGSFQNGTCPSEPPLRKRVKEVQEKLLHSDPRKCVCELCHMGVGLLPLQEIPLTSFILSLCTQSLMQMYHKMWEYVDFTGQID